MLINYRSISRQYRSVALFILIVGFGVWSPEQVFAEEVAFDTGVIKVICGRNGGGFIDEVYLDSNTDGVYADNERIVLRPQEQAGLLVSYTILAKGASRKGVAVGPVVQGAVTIKEAKVHNLEAVVNGLIDFGTYGSSPFEVRIRGMRKSAVLIADFAATIEMNALVMRSGLSPGLGRLIGSFASTNDP